jgi:hypothetical protein
MLKLGKTVLLGTADSSLGLAELGLASDVGRNDKGKKKSERDWGSRSPLAIELSGFSVFARC